MGSIQKSFTLMFDDGTSVEVPSNDERIYLATWPNQSIEVLVHYSTLAGHDPSDRIHLIVRNKDSKQGRGWLMNVEDAASVISGLAQATEVALIQGFPLQPKTSKPEAKNDEN